MVFDVKHVLTDGSSDHGSFSRQYPFPFPFSILFFANAPIHLPFHILASLDIVITLYVLFSMIFLN